MFDKNKNKTEDDSLHKDIVAKMRTMKDDMAGKKEDDYQEEKKVFQSNHSEGLRTNSPFLNNDSKAPEVGNFNHDTKPEIKNENREPIIPPIPKSFFPKVESEKKENSGDESVGNNPFPKVEPKPNIPKEEIKEPFSKNQGLFRRDELTEVEGLGDLDEYEGGKSGFFVYFSMFLIILILGGAGYYFFIIKGGELPTDYSTKGLLEYIKSPDESKVIIDETAKDENAITFTEKVNFLIIDEGNMTKEEIKRLINNKFVEMKSYQGDQLEFLLVDKNNTPIKFKKFADSFGIILTKNVSDNLIDDFSIFLSKKDGADRMGIAVGIQKKELILNSLKTDEINLLKNLNPILLDGEISPASRKTFSDSSYKNIKIRFMNLNPKPDLSIDYFVVDDYLIFSTSKESGRLIIDRLLSENTNI